MRVSTTRTLQVESSLVRLFNTVRINDAPTSDQNRVHSTTEFALVFKHSDSDKRASLSSSSRVKPNSDDHCQFVPQFLIEKRVNELVPITF